MMPKEKKDVSPEENVITPEEFEELEKKEGGKKKIKIKKVPESSGTEPKKAASRDQATDIDMLLLKTEKLEGKIEAIAEFREAVDERLSTLNQEIGELRSSIMEKDKLMREFQTGFAKIKEIAEAMEPEKIASQFAKAEEAIEKNEAVSEKLSLEIKQLRNEVRNNAAILENVKDVRNLIKLIKNLREKLAKVEENRKYTTRAAGKIESMFTDMSDRLAELQSYKDKIAFNEETMHEIMKSMDVVEARLSETAKKDELKKLEDSIEERMDKLKTDVDDRVYEIKNLFNDLLSSLKEAGLKSVLEKIGKSNMERMFATKREIEEIRGMLDALRKAARATAKEKINEFSKDEHGVVTRKQPERKYVFLSPPPRKEQPVTGIRDKIDLMIEQAENGIKNNDLDSAKKFYKKALSMYNQLNQAESYEEATAIYERIKRLYSRLRIYS